VQKILVSAHVNSGISNIEGIDITPVTFSFIGFEKKFLKAATKKFESFDKKED
jgi:hypothetical protein